MLLNTTKLLQVVSPVDGVTDILTLSGPGGALTLQPPTGQPLNIAGGGSITGTYDASGATLNGLNLSNPVVASYMGLSLTATGTNQATGLVLSRQLNVVITVPTGAAVVASGTLDQVILNRGANDLLVFPPIGGQFEANGVNTAVTLAPTGNLRLVPNSPTQWYLA